MDFKKVLTLLSEAPKTPEDHEIATARDEDLDAFTEKTGVSLPREVRKWLCQHNGSTAGPGGIFGVGRSRPHLNIDHYYAIFPHWQAAGWLPVAGDGCGNYYLLPTAEDLGAGKPVFFIDTAEDSRRPTYLVASSLELFLEFLLRKELGEHWWPFNRKMVLQADPTIVNFAAPLPWD